MAYQQYATPSYPYPAAYAAGYPGYAAPNPAAYPGYYPGYAANAQPQPHQQPYQYQQQQAYPGYMPAQNPMAMYTPQQYAAVAAGLPLPVPGDIITPENEDEWEVEDCSPHIGMTNRSIGVLLSRKGRGVR